MFRFTSQFGWIYLYNFLLTIGFHNIARLKHLSVHFPFGCSSCFDGSFRKIYNIDAIYMGRNSGATLSRLLRGFGLRDRGYCFYHGSIPHELSFC